MGRRDLKSHSNQGIAAYRDVTLQPWGSGAADLHTLDLPQREGPSSTVQKASAGTMPQSRNCLSSYVVQWHTFMQDTHDSMQIHNLWTMHACGPYDAKHVLNAC